MRNFSHFLKDCSRLFVIAWPLVINNIASISVTVADTLMVSSLGKEHLAAVAIASGLWLSLFLLGVGVIMSLAPFVAHEYGAKRFAKIGIYTRQGLWLSGCIAFLTICVLSAADFLVRAVGVPAVVASLVAEYLDALCWGVFPAYAYHTLKQMSEGVGRTIPVMFVMAFTLPVNIGLNYVFIFGLIGAPAMGAVGCAVGNAISFWLMFSLLLLYTLRSENYRDYLIWSKFELPSLLPILDLIRLGSPIGASLFMHSALFTLVALAMGRLGTVAAASHQIVLNYSSLVFMFPLAIAMATTVRVGQEMGRENPAGARSIGNSGMYLCAFISAFFGILTLYFCVPISRYYSSDSEIVALCIMLFKIAALLQFVDGVQVAASFALRGLKDTRFPMLLNALSFLGVGFGAVWCFTYVFDGGSRLVWSALVIAISTAALLLMWRFNHIMNRIEERKAI
jgi:MATE family multidrug resistance protein